MAEQLAGVPQVPGAIGGGGNCLARVRRAARRATGIPGDGLQVFDPRGVGISRSVSAAGERSQPPSAEHSSRGDDDSHEMKLRHGSLTAIARIADIRRQWNVGQQAAAYPSIASINDAYGLKK